MNFLAHLYLSRHSDKLMLGNFIADSVKGKNYELFEPEISRGILMHREIDTFTDSHPLVSQSKNILRPVFGHYSGVIIDVFYDHILAKNWKQYHDQELQQFTQDAYLLFHRHDEILPERNKNILKFMETNNWLLSYASISGIQRALSGMAKRARYESKMELATDYLEKYLTDFEKDFTLFLPLLTSHLREFGYS